MYHWHALYYVPVQFLVGSKRSFDRLSIKLNDLDLSTHMALMTFFWTAANCKICFKVLFHWEYYLWCLVDGWGVLHQRRGVIDWKWLHIVIYKKRLNRRARIQENAPFAPYNFKIVITPIRPPTLSPLSYASYGCATLRIGNSWLFLGLFSSLKWMLTRNTKCTRLTETASVSFLTHGWIKWSKLSRKVDSQQRTPIEEETKG